MQGASFRMAVGALLGHAAAVASTANQALATPRAGDGPALPDRGRSAERRPQSHGLAYPPNDASGGRCR
jgi:hypothetical protein